jgi:hypothetical protein
VNQTKKASTLTANRGFILLMLNQLRLASDAEPEGEIAQMVNNNHKFMAFLPTLR